MVRHALTGLVVLGVMGCASSGSSADPSRPERSTTTTTTTTAAGPSDPYYSEVGANAYDVGHYDISLSYSPDHPVITATTTITATAKQTLTEFHLDLSGLKIDELTVDGTRARFSRRRTVVTVRPRRPIASGATFVTQVRYHGKPRDLRSGRLGGRPHPDRLDSHPRRPGLRGQ